MPYVTYTIGAYSFINGSGSVPVWQQRTERMIYPGVDGARYRNLGEGSEPFQVETSVDVASITAGRTLLGNYAALVGAGKQAFTWKSVSYAPGGVVVMKVEEISLRSVLHIAGRKASPTNTAMLRTRWTLELKE